MGTLLAVEGGNGSLLWQILGLLSLPALVVLNGFFVAAEFALVAVRRTKVEHMIATHVRGADAVMASVDNLDRAIAATQLGITLASIALGFFAEAAIVGLFENVFTGLPAPWDLLARHTVAATFAFVIITYLHVVFGELVPKSMALQSPDRVALWVARPLNLFIFVTRPLIIVMNGTGTWILHLCGFRAHPGSHLHSVEELTLLIEDTEEAGLLGPEQAELVQNVFRLTQKEVKDCMVPREQMAALELSTPPDKVLDAVRQGAHTRMPVYEGTLDNVVGVVNTKDLFYLFSLHGVVVLADAVYDPIFLKPDEDIETALLLFRKSKRPMALVRDESGKILGLVTLEDIVEEIIGDIEDEHDVPRPRRAMARRLRKLRRPPERK